MTPEEREKRRQQARAARERRALLDRTSLGSPTVQAVTDEGKRRAEGNPTMSDKEWLALIDESLR